MKKVTSLLALILALVMLFTACGDVATTTEATKATDATTEATPEATKTTEATTATTAAKAFTHDY